MGIFSKPCLFYALLAALALGCSPDLPTLDREFSSDAERIEATRQFLDFLLGYPSELEFRDEWVVGKTVCGEIRFIGGVLEPAPIFERFFVKDDRLVLSGNYGVRGFEEAFQENCGAR